MTSHGIKEAGNSHDDVIVDIPRKQYADRLGEEKSRRIQKEWETVLKKRNVQLQRQRKSNLQK